MSFSNIRNNTRTRFSEVQTYLNHLSSLEPVNVTETVPLEFNIMKGLFHVHLYAALEKAVNELIEHTLIHIKAQRVKQNHYSIPFNTISLVDKLKSFKACGYRSFFEKAIDIFSEMTSSNVQSLNEAVFANQLQNVWTATIIEVTKAFGITNFKIEPRVKATIDELVEKRNAVAHGRESAVAVGERFRIDVIRVKMDIIINFTYQLIDVFEDYYTTKKFIKGHCKRLYTII